MPPTLLCANRIARTESRAAKRAENFSSVSFCCRIVSTSYDRLGALARDWLVGGGDNSAREFANTVEASCSRASDARDAIQQIRGRETRAAALAGRRSNGEQDFSQDRVPIFLLRRLFNC